MHLRVHVAVCMCSRLGVRFCPQDSHVPDRLEELNKTYSTSGAQLGTHVCRWLDECVCGFVCMFVCVCVCQSVCTFCYVCYVMICICECVYVCVGMYVRVYFCVSVCIWGLYICGYTFTYTSLFIYIYIFIYT